MVQVRSFAAVNVGPEDEAGALGPTTEAQESAVVAAYESALRQLAGGDSSGAEGAFHALLAGPAMASTPQTETLARVKFLSMKQLSAAQAADPRRAGEALRTLWAAAQIDPGESGLWARLSELAETYRLNGAARLALEEGLRRRPGDVVLALRLRRLLAGGGAEGIEASGGTNRNGSPAQFSVHECVVGSWAEALDAVCAAVAMDRGESKDQAAPWRRVGEPEKRTDVDFMPLFRFVERMDDRAQADPAVPQTLHAPEAGAGEPDASTSAPETTPEADCGSSAPDASVEPSCRENAPAKHAPVTPDDGASQSAPPPASSRGASSVQEQPRTRSRRATASEVAEDAAAREEAERQGMLRDCARILAAALGVGAGDLDASVALDMGLATGGEEAGPGVAAGSEGGVCENSAASAPGLSDSLRAFLSAAREECPAPILASRALEAVMESRSRVLESLGGRPAERAKSGRQLAPDPGSHADDEWRGSSLVWLLQRAFRGEVPGADRWSAAQCLNAAEAVAETLGGRVGVLEGDAGAADNGDDVPSPAPAPPPSPASPTSPASPSLPEASALGLLWLQRWRSRQGGGLAATPTILARASFAAARLEQGGGAGAAAQKRYRECRRLCFLQSSDEEEEEEEGKDGGETNDQVGSGASQSPCSAASQSPCCATSSAWPPPTPREISDARSALHTATLVRQARALATSPSLESAEKVLELLGPLLDDPRRAAPPEARRLLLDAAAQAGHLESEGRCLLRSQETRAWEAEEAKASEASSASHAEALLAWLEREERLRQQDAPGHATFCTLLLPQDEALARAVAKALAKRALAGLWRAVRADASASQAAPEARQVGASVRALVSALLLRRDAEMVARAEGRSAAPADEEESCASLAALKAAAELLAACGGLRACCGAFLRLLLRCSFDVAIEKLGDAFYRAAAYASASSTGREALSALHSALHWLFGLQLPAWLADPWCPEVLFSPSAEPPVRLASPQEAASAWAAAGPHLEDLSRAMLSQHAAFLDEVLAWLPQPPARVRDAVAGGLLRLEREAGAAERGDGLDDGGGGFPEVCHTPLLRLMSPFSTNEDDFGPQEAPFIAGPFERVYPLLYAIHCFMRPPTDAGLPSALEADFEEELGRRLAAAEWAAYYRPGEGELWAVLAAAWAAAREQVLEQACVDLSPAHWARAVDLHRRVAALRRRAVACACVAASMLRASGDPEGAAEALGVAAAELCVAHECVLPLDPGAVKAWKEGAGASLPSPHVAWALANEALSLSPLDWELHDLRARAARLFVPAGMEAVKEAAGDAGRGAPARASSRTSKRGRPPQSSRGPSPAAPSPTAAACTEELRSLARAARLAASREGGLVDPVHALHAARVAWLLRLRGRWPARLGGAEAWAAAGCVEVWGLQGEGALEISGADAGIILEQIQQYSFLDSPNPADPAADSLTCAARDVAAAQAWCLEKDRFYHPAALISALLAAAWDAPEEAAAGLARLWQRSRLPFAPNLFLCGARLAEGRGARRARARGGGAHLSPPDLGEESKPWGRAPDRCAGNGRDEARRAFWTRWRGGLRLYLQCLMLGGDARTLRACAAGLSEQAVPDPPPAPRLFESRALAWGACLLVLSSRALQAGSELSEALELGGGGAAWPEEGGAGGGGKPTPEGEEKQASLASPAVVSAALEKALASASPALVSASPAQTPASASPTQTPAPASPAPAPTSNPPPPLRAVVQAWHRARPLLSQALEVLADQGAEAAAADPRAPGWGRSCATPARQALRTLGPLGVSEDAAAAWRAGRGGALLLALARLHAGALARSRDAAGLGEAGQRLRRRFKAQPALPRWAAQLGGRLLAARLALLRPRVEALERGARLSLPKAGEATTMSSPIVCQGTSASTSSAGVAAAPAPRDAAASVSSVAPPASPSSSPPAMAHPTPAQVVAAVTQAQEAVRQAEAQLELGRAMLARCEQEAGSAAADLAAAQLEGRADAAQELAPMAFALAQRRALVAAQLEMLAQRVARRRGTASAVAKAAADFASGAAMRAADASATQAVDGSTEQQQQRLLGEQQQQRLLEEQQQQRLLGEQQQQRLLEEQQPSSSPTKVASCPSQASQSYCQMPGAQLCYSPTHAAQRARVHEALALESAEVLREAAAAYKAGAWLARPLLLAERAREERFARRAARRQEAAADGGGGAGPAARQERTAAPASEGADPVAAETPAESPVRGRLALPSPARRSASPVRRAGWEKSAAQAECEALLRKAARCQQSAKAMAWVEALPSLAAALKCAEHAARALKRHKRPAADEPDAARKKGGGRQAGADREGGGAGAAQRSPDAGIVAPSAPVAEEC